MAPDLSPRPRVYRPLAVAKAHAAGASTRAQAVDLLASWPYQPTAMPPQGEWSVISVGPRRDLTIALYRQLIDDALYDEVVHQLAAAYRETQATAGPADDY